jgi:hypothetical protein
LIQSNKITLSRVVLVLALLALAIQLALAISIYARLAYTAVSFIYPLDYGEGPLLDQTMRLASGENIYKNDFSIPPYTISNYPPVFPLIQAPVALVSGPAFWYGRLLSVLSAILTALFIGLTLFTITKDRTAGVVAGLLFLTIPYIQYWSVLNRIDSLALVLSWAALLVVVRWPDRRWGIPLTAGLLVASIFTRQSYALAAPFAAFIWLLFTARWRKGIQLAVITGAVTLGLFLLLNMLTRGGFYLNIVTANVNPFYWNTVRNYFNEFFDNSYLLVFLILAFLVLARFVWRSQTWIIALPYLFAAILSAITIGKDGSNVNYLFEFSAALAFTSGAALAWVGRSPWLKALVAVVLVFQVGMLADWTQNNFTGRVMEKVEIEPLIASMTNRVREAEGIVLADEYMGLIPLAGKRLYYQPFEFKMMAEGGIWDEQPFLDEIAQGKFELALLYFPPSWSSFEARWTPRMREVIQESYSRDTILANTWLYRPRP